MINEKGEMNNMEVQSKGFVHFFSKRNEPKKILLTPNPFLQMKGLN
jgi:hypothetical protein